MPSILIEVGRSTLYGTSTKEPTVKKVAENTDNDSNYYQAAVEALYDDIDLPRIIGFTYFTTTLLTCLIRECKLKTSLFQRLSAGRLRGG